MLFPLLYDYYCLRPVIEHSVIKQDQRVNESDLKVRAPGLDDTIDAAHII